uniref:Uncharacterized protein n=1 Tax=viral metagenome TaxID=1070528 RepID=A0A6C0E5T8_9ZZZZ
MSGKRRKGDDDKYYPFSDESEADSYNPIDRDAYVRKEDVGVPVPPVPSRGLVRESGRQIKPPTNMQQLHRDTEDIHNILPSIKESVDGIVVQAMRQMEEIHNRQYGSLLNPGQLSQEAEQSIADLQQIKLSLVSAVERIRQLNEYMERAQEDIYGKLSQTIYANYSLGQTTSQNILGQLEKGSIKFDGLDPYVQRVVRKSIHPLQLQDLITRGIITKDMDEEEEETTSSSGRGGKTKGRQQQKNKTRKKNKRQRSKVIR